REWNMRAACNVQIAVACIDGHHNHIGIAIQLLESSALKISFGTLKRTGRINGNRMRKLRGGLLHLGSVEYASIIVNLHRIAVPTRAQGEQQQKHQKPQKKASGAS